jgi:hypothetical protein
MLDCTTSKIGSNKELEKMWKESVVAYCEVLSCRLPGETTENHENISQEGWYPIRDQLRGPSNVHSSEYWGKYGLDMNLTTRLQQEPRLRTHGSVSTLHHTSLWRLN